MTDIELLTEISAKLSDLKMYSLFIISIMIIIFFWKGWVEWH